MSRPAVQPSPALAVLRRATRMEHGRLEQRLALTGELTTRRWTKVLEAFLGYVGPLEERLAAGGVLDPVLDDLAARRRAGLLEADLRALGASPLYAPRCFVLPDVASVADAVGVAYVLEGSTLGGQVVARAVRRDAPQLAVALSYFSAGGDPVGPRWRSFVSALNRWPGDAEHAARTAVSTFTTLEAWLEQQGVLRA